MTDDYSYSDTNRIEDTSINTESSFSLYIMYEISK
jgi:hypothetical protein